MQKINEKGLHQYMVRGPKSMCEIREDAVEQHMDAD